MFSKLQGSLPNTMDEATPDATLDRILREWEDHLATTNLLHVSCIHLTTEISPIPFPTSVLLIGWFLFQA